MNHVRLQRCRGFTLIELMVTITIAALLMFAVMPSISGWMRDLRIRNAAESIQNGLQRARMEALRTNLPVSLWLVTDPDSDSCALSSASSSWVVALASPAGACVSDMASFVEKYRAGADAVGVTVATVQTTSDTATAAASRIMFNGFGQVATPGGGSPITQIVINLTHAATDARALRVEVTNGGSVRMCDPSVSSTDSRRCML